MLIIISSVLAITCSMLLGIAPPAITIRLDSLNGPTLRPIPEGRNKMGAV